MANYNVWTTHDGGRWTNYNRQDPSAPKPMTLNEAQSTCRFLNGAEQVSGQKVFTVRELLSDGKPGQVVNENGDVLPTTSEPVQTATATDTPAEAPAFDFDSYNSSIPGGRKEYLF